MKQVKFNSFIHRYQILKGGRFKMAGYSEVTREIAFHEG